MLASEDVHTNILDLPCTVVCRSFLHWLASTDRCGSVVLPAVCCQQLSRALRDHARSIPGKSQLFINAFAKALEVRAAEG